MSHRSVKNEAVVKTTRFQKNYRADDELVSELESPPKKLCIVGTLIEEHPNGKQIADAVKNPAWSTTQLAPVLSRRVGHAVSADSVSKHRKRACVCGK